MEMKERQRWRTEEDSILLAYVRQYGPREWHLISHRMNVPLDRDAKSCLERWKNYLKPGIKKGSLTQEEQNLVIRLQEKYGNKWKKIASEVPGRTAKRLGKWWEVFKEKQQREELKESSKLMSNAVEPSVKYDRILENFAEKLVKDHTQSMLPPWLNTNSSNNIPSVALSLSPAMSPPVLEIGECWKEVNESYNALLAHKKEAAWRVRRVEIQMEAEKGSKKREVVEEIEAKIRGLREEERRELGRIDRECREELDELRREAEVKEMKMMEMWKVKHLRLGELTTKMMNRSNRI